MGFYTFAISSLLFVPLGALTPEKNVDTDKQGINIDIAFAKAGKINGGIGDNLLSVDLAVPYIHIKPNELENTTQIAEEALENITINAVSNDEYNKAMQTLMELTPEEMITEIIAKINKLEALKTELGAEEQIVRMQLSNRNTIPSTTIRVSRPVAVNPYLNPYG
ncbi:hypothetical protein BdWA1_000153 [Babesia duncani]|uniref:Uncharacterized protein n=1 Tax=Babesia duncani TaxID=323732 RepID=A0AAD9UPR2_9APIC|nr:hypothetical protein BdWA1_000153 [Babesia duncani]